MNVVGKPSLHTAGETGVYSRSDSGLAENQKPPAMYYDVHYLGLHDGAFL
jgi:hypothetical protein